MVILNHLMTEVHIIIRGKKTTSIISLVTMIHTRVKTTIKNNTKVVMITEITDVYAPIGNLS